MVPSKKNNFRYSHIQSSGGEIRVVVLAQSTKADATIHCNLYNIFLDDGIEFEALSYVWGDHTLSSEIHLDNEGFWITPNLESALRHLRLPDRPRVLWIDFICIDQNSIEERAQQVALMGRIYESSCWDVLWMGPELEKYCHALPILEHRFSPHERQAHDELATLLQNSHSLAWDQLIAFFKSPVWQRMWIVQELVLAKEMFISCGSTYFSYSSIKWIAMLLITPRYIDRMPIEAYQGSTQVANIIGHRYWRDRGVPNDLLSLWYDFGWSKCQNVRDKIYAILNIVTDNLGVHPDYNISPRELFIHVTRKYILQQRDLRILGYAWNASPTSADHQNLQKVQLAISNMTPKEQPYTLPSWSADFGSDEQPYCARYFFERSKDPKVKATIPWNPMCSSLLEKSKDLSQLCLLGVTLDEIGMVTESTRGWQAARIVEQYYKSIPRSLKSPKSKYFNGDTLKQAYWVTVLTGMARLNDDNWRYQAVQSSTALENAQRKSKSWCLGRLFGKKATRKSEVSASDYALARSAESHLKEHVVESTRYSVLCITKNDYMALVPDHTEPGDLICVLYGGCTPFVLRPVAGKHKEQLMMMIGPAYVHGFMDELPLKWRDRGVLKERQFVVV